MKYLFFCVISALVKFSLCDELKVSTKYGDVMGSYDKLTGNRVFLGIPYASPPVGNLRFKPPQPPKAWSHLHIKLWNLDLLVIN